MKRVLIVDDEAANREFLTAFFEKRGFNVTVAKDGVEAVHIFRKADEPFDFVLSDNHMPRMNGIDFVIAMFELEPEQKVAMMTADPSLVLNTLRAAGHGQTKVFWKPFSIIRDLIPHLQDIGLLDG